MPHIITPTLEVVEHPVVQEAEIDPEVIRIFQLAEAVFDQHDALQLAINAGTGLYEQRVVHAEDPNLKLTVIAQKAVRPQYGLGLLIARLGVHEGTDEMYLAVERKHARKYEFSDDPYVGMFSEIYDTHLRKRGSSQPSITL